MKYTVDALIDLPEEMCDNCEHVKCVQLWKTVIENLMATIIHATVH